MTTSFISEFEMRWYGKELQYRMVGHVFIDDGEESGIVDTITDDWITCPSVTIHKETPELNRRLNEIENNLAKAKREIEDLQRANEKVMALFTRKPNDQT